MRVRWRCCVAAVFYNCVRVWFDWFCVLVCVFGFTCLGVGLCFVSMCCRCMLFCLFCLSSFSLTCAVVADKFAVVICS